MLRLPRFKPLRKAPEVPGGTAARPWRDVSRQIAWNDGWIAAKAGRPFEDNPWKPDDRT